MTYEGNGGGDAKIVETLDRLRAAVSEMNNIASGTTDVEADKFGRRIDTLREELLTSTPTGMLGVLAKAHAAADLIEGEPCDLDGRFAISIRRDLVRLIGAGADVAPLSPIPDHNDERILIAFDEWEEARKAYDAEGDTFSPGQNEGRRQELADRMWAAWHRVMELPATGGVGMALKIKAGVMLDGHNIDDPKAMSKEGRFGKEYYRTAPTGDAIFFTYHDAVRILARREPEERIVDLFNEHNELFIDLFAPDAPDTDDDPDRRRREQRRCDLMVREVAEAPSASAVGAAIKAFMLWYNFSIVDGGAPDLSGLNAVHAVCALHGLRIVAPFETKRAGGFEYVGSDRGVLYRSDVRPALWVSAPAPVDDREIIETAKRAAELEAEESRLMETGEDDDPRQISDTRIALDCMLVEEMKPNTVAGLMAKAERLLTIVGSYEGGVWRSKPDIERNGALDTAVIAWSIGQDLQRMFGDQKAAAPAESPDAAAPRQDPLVPLWNEWEGLEAEDNAAEARLVALRAAKAETPQPGVQEAITEASPGVVAMPTDPALVAFDSRNKVWVETFADGNATDEACGRACELDSPLIHIRATTPAGLAAKLWSMLDLMAVWTSDESDPPHYADRALSVFHDHCAMHRLTCLGVVCKVGGGIVWQGSDRGVPVKVDDPAKANTLQNVAETNGRAA